MNPFFITNTETTKTYPIYLTSCDIQYEELGIHRPLGFPDPQIIFTAQGEGEITIDNEVFTLKSNTLLFLPAYIPHDYRPKTLPWITHWISFNGLNLTPLLNTLNLNKIRLLHNEELSDLWIYLTKIHSLCVMGYAMNAFKISVLLYELLNDVHQIFYTQEKSLSNHKSPSSMALIQKAYHYIQLHYQEDFTLDNLAQYLDITPQYVCRIFQQSLNLRPFEFIHGVRIDKSKQLLIQSPHLSVYEVAKSVGFKDASYYGAIFKRYESISPAVFRKLHSRIK